jgi:hypothetical protein
MIICADKEQTARYNELFIITGESTAPPFDALVLCPLANPIRYSRSDNYNLARRVNKKLHPSFRYFSATYE